jgi:ATP-binding cassette subfamily F protein 3
MMFSGDDALKKISVLSGGEKSRVMLGKLLVSPTNLLLLDEPTNHLDIYARETLEEALDAFKGTTLLVSHDRRLLDGIVDKLLVLGSGKPVLHLGNYSAFAERLKAAEKAEQARKAAIKTKQPSAKSSKKPAPHRIKRKHTYDELESLIIAHEERLREIELEIYKKEVYMDPVLSRKLEEEARTLKRELNDLYEEWDTWA